MTAMLPDRTGVAAQPRLSPRRRSGLRISLARVLRTTGEMLYLRLFAGIGLREYRTLGLHRDAIPWSEKKRFAGRRWYLSTIERINPREYRTAAWHKILAGGVLDTFAIPSPRFYGTAGPSGLTRDGEPLRGPRDLERLIERYRLEQLCFKLVAGWSGRGFMVVRFRRDDTGALRAHLARRAGSMSLDRFWQDVIVDVENSDASPRQRAFGYMCQEVIEQHPALSVYHPDSLNTVRVWMYQNGPGDWTMFGAVLRMGTGGANIDNGAGGGIGAPIDVERGTLGRAARRARPGVTFAEYAKHPTTGTPIEGTTIPCWSDVEPLCRRACAAFPFLRFMGLDVAMTRDGPVVVEVEADPHTSHQAHLGRGIRPLLTRLAPRLAPRN